MNEMMIFPKTLDEFIEQYSFIDKEEIYTNKNELIQVFRIKQWEEHKQLENQRLTDLLIYALLPKKIYDHELSTDTMNKFREVISSNLNDDTCTLRQQLVDCWNNIGKEKQSTIFDYTKK